jgi:hypothetical protein
MLVFFLAYSSTMKMEVTNSSETSVDIQRTTRRYILEDKTRNYSLLFLVIVFIDIRGRVAEFSVIWAT